MASTRRRSWAAPHMWRLTAVIVMWAALDERAAEAKPAALRNDTGLPAGPDERRVFYNIAHMVNSIEEVDEFVGRNANALEIDVSFFDNGFAGQSHHGAPCDCLRQCGGSAVLSELLDYIREKVDEYHAPIALLLLDLKVSKLSEEAKLKAGHSVVSQLVNHLWEPAKRRVNVVLSVPRVEDHLVIKSALEALDEPWKLQYVENFGFDLSSGDVHDKVQEVFTKYGITERIWQGQGITNCVSTLASNKHLKEAITLRDIGGHPSKVYKWTIDLSSYMSAALDLGVDGIITNMPERLHDLIVTKYADRYRLATADDDPWARHPALAEPKTAKRPALSIVENVKEIGEQKVMFAVDTVRSILGLQSAEPSRS